MSQASETPMDKRRVVEETFFYSSATIVSKGMLVVAGLIVARLLGPALLGMLSLFMLMVDYSIFATLGLSEVLKRDIPLLRGAGQAERAELVKNQIFTCMMVIALALAAGMAAFSFMGRGEPIFLRGLRVTAVIVVLNIFFWVLFILLCSDRRFLVVAQNTLLYAVAKLILTCSLAYFYGLLGALYALLLTYVASIAFIQWVQRYRLQFVLCDRRAVAALLRDGLPLMALSATYFATFSLDRLMIATCLDQTSLGYYQLAVVASAVVFYVPDTVASVFFPRFLELYGKTKEATGLAKYYLDATFITSCLMPAVIGTVALALPVPVHWILPKYVPGLDAARILLCGFFLFSVAPISVRLLIAIGRQNAALVIQIAALAAGVAVNFVLIRLGLGIRGVALGTSACFLLFAVMLMAYLLAHMGRAWRDIVRDVAGWLLPFGWLCLWLWAISQVRPDYAHLKTAALWDACRCLVFLAGNAPLLYYANKRTGVVAELLRAVWARLGGGRKDA